MTMWNEVARAAPRSAFLQISAAPSPLKGSVGEGAGALTCGLLAAVLGRSLLLQPAVSTATVRRAVIVATRWFIGSHPCGGSAGGGPPKAPPLSHPAPRGPCTPGGRPRGQRPRGGGPPPRAHPPAGEKIRGRGFL